MRATWHQFILTAIVPVGQALQVDYGLNTCPWHPLVSSFEQYMCAPQDITGHSMQDEATVQLREEAGFAGRNRWQSLPDCFDEYCVYTNNNFFGRGMSTVTTATNQARIAEIQIPETDIERHENVHAVDIHGKGKGLVATGPIAKGERIMAARPALLVHRDAFPELQPTDIYYLMDTAINSLPETRRESYLAQSAAMGGHKVTDILFTNSFQIALGDEDGFHYGNYPESSLLNHDCRPNLAFFVDKNLTHQTHAVRDIAAGEELTISYLDALQVRSARQERTRDSLGFACSCAQCALPKTDSDASDRRLLVIAQMESEMSDFNNKKIPPSMIEEYVALYRRERLEYKIAGAYTLAALNYNMVGKAGMAKKYARLSVEAGLLENGPDSTEVRQMQTLADDPRSHWSWNVKPHV
ncbi:hypothetical protein F4808DRAFT_118711 [Astrocystis sublimbata]|nr:hypothetical protein F4808DRAFT_118711 [Astrocystis sublimbata]